MSEQLAPEPEGLAPLSGAEDPAEERNEAGFLKTTIEERGPVLPIGVINGNPPVLERHFDFKDYYFEEEAALNKLRNRKEGPGQHPGKIVTEVMAYMLTDWMGRTDYQTTALKNRRLGVDGAFMTDVLYAYVWLRINSMSPIYETQVNCGACGHDWRWKTSLKGAEVTCCDSIEDLDKTYKLQTPIKWSSKTYDTVHLRPPPWSAVSNHPMGRSNQSQVKANMMMSAIRGISNSADKKQTAIGLGGEIAKKLKKIDFELLAVFVDEAFPSVDLNFLIECESCGNEFLHMLQWNFDFFFAGSSLPRQKAS